jgi:hypothetical protein
MNDTMHLLVIEGEDKGRQINVPAEGARLGRSSTNDIVVTDAMLSRHHCRLYFRTGDGLWVSDLGSANETLVDDEPVTDVALRRGSLVTVGDTILRVEDDGRAVVPATAVDLGLGSAAVAGPAAAAGNARPGLGKLLFTVGLAIAAVAVALVGKAIIDKPKPPSLTYTPDPQEWALAVSYEKVQASRDHIFRYDLTITPDHRIAVAVDDPASNRHIREEEKSVDPELLRELAEDLLDSGFFDLDPEYRGIQPDLYNQYALRITVGKDTHRVVVLNRPEPPIFEKVRDRIENFGKVELKIYAIGKTADHLIELAADAKLNGEKLYRERAIKHGNLSAAIKTLRESEWYLETVSPKPEFLSEVIELRKQCDAELEQHHIDQNFRAVRAMETRDWATASTELRIIMAMIPSRADQRYRDAVEQLKEVEARLESEK